MKFEKIAEIKFMYKNCDESKINQMNQELEDIKNEMELIKAKNIQEAKEKMQESTRKLHLEKQILLFQVQGSQE